MLSLFKALAEQDPSHAVQAGAIEVVAEAMCQSALSEECFEQGCIIISNVASAAIDGHAEASRALSGVRVPTALVRGFERHASNMATELGEVAVYALMQLACIDVSSAIAAGLAPVVIRAASRSDTSGWLLFLCARTLSWCACRGGEGGHEELRKAGAVPALLNVVKHAALCDPSFGEPFGMANALDSLQLEARKALALLVGAPLPSCSGTVGSQYARSGLTVAVLVRGDRAVVLGLVGRPELNGCVGTVVEVSEHGCGPDPSSRRYGFRCDILTAAAQGAGVSTGGGFRLRSENLVLAPLEVAKQVDALDDARKGSGELPAYLETKFGKARVSVVMPNRAS